MGAKQKLNRRIGNAKKRKRVSKKKQINMMEEAFLRFPHLPEQILEKLDNKSLTNSRVVGASWHNFIDGREYLWTRFKDAIDDLTEKCKYGETPFHLACANGQSGIAEMIMSNFARLSIDLNAKEDIAGWTAFHFSCRNGHTNIAEMLMKNSVEFNIDLNHCIDIQAVRSQGSFLVT